MKVLNRLVVAAICICGVVQIILLEIRSSPATLEIHAQSQPRKVMENECCSCYTQPRLLSWFDKIVRAYWLIRHDILTAREPVDYSQVGTEPQANQRATLFTAIPRQRYTHALHSWRNFCAMAMT
jgi:hypothetical protein